MKKLKNKLFLPLILLTLMLSGITVSAAKGVERSPDNKAWTTDDGVTDFYHGQEGERVTFKPVTPIQVQKGQHIYSDEIEGIMDVAYWELVYHDHTCIHNGYPVNGAYKWHEVPFGKNNCLRELQPGWIPHCAKCGREIGVLFYSTKDTISTVPQIDTRDDYYSRCAYSDCKNLEQGALIDHECDNVSWNRYYINYRRNGMPGGYMTKSTHYYNNATTFHGNTVQPQEKLNKNQFFITGGVFTGWNTKPDGSGISFTDEEDFLSVQTKLNLGNENKENTIIDLYAQWRPAEGFLSINPNGGSYSGENPVNKGFMETLQLDASKLTAPKGHTVSFDSNGGNPVASIQSTKSFDYWSLEKPFKGIFDFSTNTYTFGSIGGDWYDGCTDTIKAEYKNDTVTLPSATHPGGSHFGGWFADKDCTIFAGGPGEEITVTEDTTLYAKWSTLHLESKENWSANNGKGAVDLSWLQNDSAQKVYKVFQSREGEQGYGFKQVTSANSMESQLPTQTWNYTGGKEQTITIPYTGYYDFTVAGAQGSNTAQKAGGYGGAVSGRIYLEEGETLSIDAGGQNGVGYRAPGGYGNFFGRGGGGSYIWSNKQGWIAIAGGGGAATDLEAGHPGGASVASGNGNPNTNAMVGHSGGAGGGGGYVGGNAGEQIIHHHSAACYRDNSKDIMSQVNQGLVYKGQRTQDHMDDGDRLNNAITEVGTIGSLIPVEGCTNLALVATQHYRWGNSGQRYLPNNSYVGVYNQNGTLIWSQSAQGMINWSKGEFNRAAIGLAQGGRWWDGGETTRQIFNADYDGSYESATYSWLHYDDAGNVTRYQAEHSVRDAYNYVNGKYYPDNNLAAKFLPEIYSQGNNDWWGDVLYTYRYNVPIPAGTTGIYIYNSAVGSSSFEMPLSDVTYAYLSGGKQLVCGYSEGQVVSSKPAYGGSNYYHSNATNVSSRQGNRAGDGYVTLTCVQTGTFKQNYLNGVSAPDIAAPNTPKLSIDSYESNNDRVKVTWNNPGDTGTLYKHIVKSYYPSNFAEMLTSNTVYDTLVSGVTGYRYKVDGSPNSTVTATDDFTNQQYLDISRNDNGTNGYLHVAAQDKAGNVGATAHITIPAKDAPIDPGNPENPVFYPVDVSPLRITGTDNNVYKKVIPDERPELYPPSIFYYVRADGETPFVLSYDGWINGPASKNYQINYMRLDFYGVPVYKYGNYYETLYRPDDADEQINLGEDALELTTERDDGSYTGEIVSYASHTAFDRHNDLKNIYLERGYTISEDCNGMEILASGHAGAISEVSEGNIEETVWDNSLEEITIVADAEAPTISGDGYDFLKDHESIDIGDYPDGLVLEIEATDTGSGLKEVILSVMNRDNYKTKDFKGTVDASGEKAVIRIDVSENDSLFKGDIAFTIKAVDNVGNATETTEDLSEFSLNTVMKSTTFTEDEKPVPTEYQKGESAVLVIRTTGYADRLRIEFPSEFASEDFETVREIVYDKPVSGSEDYWDDLNRYGVRTEVLEFQMPMHVEERDNYQINITAYKDGNPVDITNGTTSKTLTDTQVFSIKGDLRTRTRTVIMPINK